MTQVALATITVRTLMNATGVTTNHAIAGLVEKQPEAFAGLKRSTLRWYVRLAFKNLTDTGDYKVAREKGKRDNILMPVLNETFLTKAAIRIEAAEMRKEGTPRKDIVQILSEDFGLTKRDIEQHLKGTN